MAPDANFESMSYNPFTVNDNFFNSESDPDIKFYSHIYEIREGFECLCKNCFETFKNFYSKLNCTFSVICFSET